MKCQNCGAELKDGARFCRECGTRVQSSTPHFCRECGSPISQSSKFCPTCGVALFEIKRNEIKEKNENKAAESEEWTYYPDSPVQKNRGEREWKSHLNPSNILRNVGTGRRSDSEKTRSQKGDKGAFVIGALICIICVVLWIVPRNHKEKTPAPEDTISAQEKLSEPSDFPEITPTPTPKSTPTPSPTPTPSSSVSYSTNDQETAKKGNSGVFSYRSRGGTYYTYFIIDFDEGYVYTFTEGNESGTCDRIKIESGDLNSVLIITYHDGEVTWSYGLHFKWKNSPDHLVMQDNDGFEYDYYTTNLNEALALMNKKKILDY